jgi:hypothetical protein
MRLPGARTNGHEWRDLLPAAALLIVSTAAIVATALSPSGDRGQYAVVAPPWYTIGQTVELIVAAGGDLIDFGDLTNVVIVHSDRPAFVWALYRAGAWLVIDPVGVRGCFGFEQSPARTSGGE